ncbi:MAG: lipopolysaccharide biosynthesis protein [Gammaproteobacteria bacterium]
MLKKLLSDSLWYFVATALRAAGPFLLLPILTRYVGTAEFGLYAMFQVLVWLAIPLAGLNTHSAVLRQHVDRDDGQFSAYVGSCFAIFAASCVVLMLAAAVLAPQVESVTGFPTSLWCFYPLVAMSQYVISVRLAIWQMEQRPRTYGALAVTQTLGYLILAVLLVTVWGTGWQGIVYAQTAVYGVLAIASFASLLRSGHLAWQLDKRHVRSALAYSLPLVPYSLLTWVLTAADRVMLKSYGGLEATGLYAAGYQIGVAVMVLQMAANQAWVPWFFRQLKADTPSAKRDVIRMTYGYFVALLLVAGVVWLLAGWIVVTFLGEQFAPAVSVVPWIALSCVFNGFYVNFGNYFFYLRRTGVLAGVMALAALGNILLNYLLIPSFGIRGAAMASAAAYLIAFVVLFAPLKRAISMPWRAALTDK